MCGIEKNSRSTDPVEYGGGLQYAHPPLRKTLNVIFIHYADCGLSVSYLQMVDCHNFTHFFAVSLKVLKSSREQGVLSSGHCSRCSIICVSIVYADCLCWCSIVYAGVPLFMLIAVTNKPPDISLKILILHKNKGLHCDGPVKFAKCHFRV